MNKKIRNLLILVTILFATFLSTAFKVDQRQQVLIVQFGEPINVIKEPGLHFKIPFVQNLIYFDKRILDLTITDQELIANDQKRIIINAFTKYKIEDPLKFYKTVRSVYGVSSKLSAVLDSSLRKIIGEFKLNQLLTENRGDIMTKIKDVVNLEAKIYGIDIVDVRIMRSDLPKENSDSIFARMRAEREKEAREIRAQGAEESDKIRAEADKNRTIILAQAEKKSNLTRGEGEARANRIYANGYSLDPDFADFYRSMKAYEKSFNQENTNFVISPNGEFFKYFGNANF
jgi:membrane protease subunit HflC